MKYSLKSSFSRLTLAVFAAVFFVTILGRAVAVTGAWAFCEGWLVCTPIAPLGYLKLAHMLMVVIASVLVILLLRKAWREQRDQNLILPLTTVTGVLFFWAGVRWLDSCDTQLSVAFGCPAYHERDCLVGFAGRFGLHVWCAGAGCDKN